MRSLAIRLTIRTDYCEHGKRDNVVFLVLFILFIIAHVYNYKRKIFRRFGAMREGKRGARKEFTGS